MVEYPSEHGLGDPNTVKSVFDAMVNLRILQAKPDKIILAACIPSWQEQHIHVEVSPIPHL